MYYYLAIDFGDSYVGLSVSNGFLAKPIEVFKYPQNNYLVLRNHLLKVISLVKPKVIVIGVPSRKESENRIKGIFLTFIFTEESLREKIVWTNEDYSTEEAVKLKKRKRMREDSIAASIILENYFVKSLGQKRNIDHE